MHMCLNDQVSEGHFGAQCYVEENVPNSICVAAEVVVVILD